MNLPWYLQPAFIPVHPQDLVLWLNSSSWDGTTWRNLAPSYSNVNHGTLTNGVGIGDLIHPSGVFSAPRKFDGQNDYVNCGNDSSLNITEAITIEARVKFDTLGNQHFISRYAWVAGDERVFTFSHTEMDVFHFYISQDGTSENRAHFTTTDTFTSLTDWYHVVGVFDGSSQTIKIYVNGVNEAGTTTGTIPTTMHTNNIPVYIGTLYEETLHINGSIDGVKIYNRALSASDSVHNYTHSPIYCMQHGTDPLSLLSQTSQEAARVVV